MHRQRTRTRRLGIVALIAVALLAGLLAACSDPAAERAEDPRPNVVVIMTDDQTLAELASMPKTKRYLTDEGTNFVNSFVSFPLCCPARSTYLTGTYAHTHGVEDNVPPKGGNDKLDQSQTLPVWLQAAGYTTGHVGKYLNGYGDEAIGERPAAVPPGYDDWFGLIDPDVLKYFGFTVLDNGERRTYEDTDANYQTDVLADRAVADIASFSEQGKPFYLSIWPLAPHSGTGRGRPTITKENGATQDIGVAPVPAPRHAGLFPDATFPRTDSWFEPDISDKPDEMAQTRQRMDQGISDLGLDGLDIEEVVDVTYRSRLQSLQAVDDLIEKVVIALDEQGQLDNTVIMFTSDNGWLYGEHGIPFAKVVLYEESIRVPMVVRGPGFPKGQVVTQPTVNVDLTATVLDAADATAAIAQQGTPLQVVANDPEAGKDRAVLLEAAWEKFDYDAVRVAGYMYAEYTSGSVELYDLFNDPHQLDNKAGDPLYSGVQRRLSQALAELRACQGQGCIVTVPQAELRGS